MKFEVVVTEDGSPTLYDRSTDQGEWMHSKKGAWAETLFIYGRLWNVVKKIDNPNVCIVGLGLGMIEMMILADKFLPHKITSFESEPELVSSLKTWILEGRGDLAGHYDKIARLAGVDRTTLGNALESGTWEIFGSLKEGSESKTKFHGLFFDAYSNKSSPDLWSPEFLGGFLENFAAPECALATYASTGNLNRALREKGFKNWQLEGFAGKRESTFASRNIAISP